MSDEEQYSQDIADPLDQVNPVPFGILIDDQFRRQVISNIAYEQKTVRNEEDETEETVTRIAEPGAAALYAHALSPQVALLDLSPNIAQAIRMETDILFYIGGLKYRRTKHRVPLSVAHSAFNNTINGMSTEGKFSVFLTKMSGSIREFITGTRRDEKK